MATAYGATVNHWRAYIDYSTSTTASQVKVDCSGIGMESVSWGFSISNGITSYVSISGSSWHPSATGGFTSASSANTKKNFIPDGSRGYAFNRGHAAYTATVTNKVTNASGYMNGTSTATVSVTVPAKDSWAVAFDANGGAGAPASQTKWRDEALTLSATRPTWAGHTFQGWATSEGGTVAYQPGATYSANAAATLHAVWSVDYVAPTASSLTAYRCDSDGTASDAGTSAKLTLAWSVDTSVTAGNEATDVTFRWRVRGTDDWTESAVAASGTSGTTSVVASGFDADSAYEVSGTVTDAKGGTATASGIVTGQYFTLDLAGGGRGVGVGVAAPTSGLSVAMDATFTGGLGAASLNGHPLADGAFATLYASSLGGGCYWWCVNGVVTVALNAKLAAFTSWQALTLGTLPADYRPPTGVVQAVSVQNVSSHTMQLRVGTDGKVVASSQGGSGATSNWMWATITYPVL